MDAARKIRNAVATVTLLRQAVEVSPALQTGVMEVKRIQSQRFAGTYADLLDHGSYHDAATFFLQELYSDKDFAGRDAQISRVAGAIEKLFPSQVAETAVAMAELHSLTEDLDQAMALAWLEQADENLTPSQRYVRAWRGVGRRVDREDQLAAVLAVGRRMIHLTRTPGLRMMLKMMRRPAAAAGLGSLHGFMETGFDTFAAMSGGGGGAAFLGTIETREAELLRKLFDADLVACETELARTLGQAL